jgi:hypothetical protein
MATPAHLSSQPAPPAATNALGPRMTFDSNEYHFGKVISGELVKHVFIVSNAGDQTLEITKVAPGCHCTTAGDWTHQIAPGKTGEIPIQFDSGAFRGEVQKTIMVTSNDKLAPNQTIVLRGTVWKAIEVSPQFAYINVMPDAPSNSTAVVRITTQTDEPVTLSEPTSANGSFKAALQTITPGKEFTVTITAVPPFAIGSTAGTISIKTSMAKMPVINITAIAMMQAAVAVTPSQIVLPTQIVGWMTNVISINANASKALALSDPEASDKRVLVQLREITPGRVFQLAVVFPPGFQLAPDQPRVELRVKSNYEQTPVIVVPIRQVPLQMAAPPPMPHARVVSQNPPPPQAAGHP